MLCEWRLKRSRLLCADARALWRQVITSAEFHPSECHTFAFASSKGCIRLADLRASALADRAVRTYEEVRRAPAGLPAAHHAVLSAACRSKASGSAKCQAVRADWQAANLKRQHRLQGSRV